MNRLITIHLIAVASTIVVIAILIFLVKRRYFRRRKDFVEKLPTKAPSFRATGTSKVQQDHATIHHQPEHMDGRRRGNQQGVPRGGCAKLFSWADHPSLVDDAVENGWSQFAFLCNAPSTPRATLLGLCAVGDHGKEIEAEITWEVCQNSVEFMQKIMFNSGVKRVSMSQPSTAAASVIRTALPLPGPCLENNCAFPQEAYFEIIILQSESEDDEPIGKVKEGEKIKLIQENSNPKATSESLIHVTGSHKGNKDEELEVDNGTHEGSGKGESIKLSLGLTTGSSLSSKLPGNYPGSIGFNSDGSVYLDGIKLVFESEEEEWGRKDNVIGCGFDPKQKKVFFTLDSKMVRVVHCKSEEFGSPLYPILAANTHTTVLVNMGQSEFKYEPANAQRTANPCFIHPPRDYSLGDDMGYEDSRDLFSMTFDSQWLNTCTIKGTPTATSKRAKGFDEEAAEVELYEIALGESGRISSTAAQ
ncbi:hypothetical protein CJ030_MR3G017001 [Morella rubra]|uniref:B30.2/SPRY domain-containing protein n=1 Tax=Morella rubra TaxID=262757 RepID=A0A6A1W7W7_9ROSI|nr:hypothetical protein CJ030_MR3G017001 [Morella rubra]